MINKILELRKSYLIYGITAPSLMKHIRIFLSEKEDLIGFRSYVPYLIDDMFRYYELAHYCGMLHDGIPEAWDIISVEEEYIDNVTNEFRQIQDNKKIFLSPLLAENLLEEAKSLYDRSVQGEKSVGLKVENKFHLVSYNKNLAGLAYVKLEQLIHLLEKKEFKTKIDKIKEAEAIFYGRLTAKTYTSLIEEKLEKLDSMNFSSELTNTRNVANISKLICEIRNI